MPLNKNKIIIIGGLILIVIIGLVLIFARSGPKQAQLPAEPAGILTLWGVFDDQKIMEDLLTELSVTTGIQVQYVGFNDPETYERELINALAGGRGPDIFMFHNTWLPKHYDKITPLPADVLQFENFRQLFPDVVEQNFTRQGTIFALPASIDTLALFYNKDSFNQAAIVNPPKNWTEFQDAVIKLRLVESSTKKIIRAGAAFGGSAKSVNRAKDIISLLMLQTRVPMVDPDWTKATFAEKGEQAVSFYTQFANPASPLYTWHDDFMNSLDAFSQSKAAMMLNYSYQIPVLREKNPFLNFAIAPVPQSTPTQENPIPDQATIANYWGFAVSNGAGFPSTAWRFILSLTTNPDAARQYIKTFGKPPALKSLIQEYAGDPQLAVFANQSLIADSWPQFDEIKTEEIFSDMVEQILKGQLPIKEALNKAQEQISRLMSRGGIQ